MLLDFTMDARTVLIHAGAHASRLGHRQISGEHFLLALVAAGSPAAGVLREHGITPERVEEEIVRLEGLGAGGAVFAGLDASALAAIGIDLDVVRARVEAAFGPEALDQAGQAISRKPRQGLLAGLTPGNPRSMPPGPADGWRRRRRIRHGVPPPAIPPAPPGRYHAAGVRSGGRIFAGSEAKAVMEKSIRETQVLHDPQTGAVHIALALVSTSSGLVPEILSRLGGSPPALRTAILGRYRHAG